jgi:hypothetical protein
MAFCSAPTLGKFRPSAAAMNPSYCRVNAETLRPSQCGFPGYQRISWRTTKPVSVTSNTIPQPKGPMPAAHRRWGSLLAVVPNRLPLAPQGAALCGRSTLGDRQKSLGYATGIVQRMIISMQLKTTAQCFSSAMSLPRCSVRLPQLNFLAVLLGACCKRSEKVQWRLDVGPFRF